MKKIYVIILLISLMPALAFAQSLKQAQKAMDRYDYTTAVQILKKAVSDAIDHDEAVLMLAECYRMQRDIFNTKAWYANAVTIPNVKPEAFLYYGQALQATGDYSLARQMFQKYESMAGNGKGRRFAIACDSVLGPWKGIKPTFQINNVHTINTAQSDFGAAFYNDGLIFASDYMPPTSNKQYGWTGRGYLDIMQSFPTAPEEFYGEMGKPSKFAKEFNQMYHDGPASFDKAGSVVFITRTNTDEAAKKDGYKTNLLKLFFAEKQANGEWGKLQAFKLNSPEYSVGHAALSPDGKTLYFVSDMPGGEGGTDIYKCEKQGEGWGPAVNLGKTINTPENEMFPWISDEGKLFFSSSGHPGYGALDVFCSKPTGSGWSTPKNLKTPVNSSFDDFAFAYAPQATTGFFSSNRPGGEGNDDIYAFKYVEPEPEIVKPGDVKIPGAFLTGVVKDKTTGNPLENATVFAFNPNNGKVLVLKTGPDGVYKGEVDRPGDYVVKAMKPTFTPDCTPFAIHKVEPGKTYEAPRPLLLDKLELNRAFKIDNIYYDLDKYFIRDDAKPELDKLVTLMKQNPINVELGSHTDSRASFAYNEKLSQNRAEAAVDYIVSRGIDRSRITAKGYGENQLTNKCADGVACTEEEHQQNRRTEFKITSYTSPDQQLGQFNPDLFNDGEELDIRLMPPNFFDPCK